MYKTFTCINLCRLCVYDTYINNDVNWKILSECVLKRLELVSDIEKVSLKVWNKEVVSLSVHRVNSVICLFVIYICMFNCIYIYICIYLYIRVISVIFIYFCIYIFVYICIYNYIYLDIYLFVILRKPSFLKFIFFYFKIKYFFYGFFFST